MKLAVLLAWAVAVAGAQEFVPGAVWPDVDGKPIQAHSAGVLEAGGVYYWYGEDKTLGNFNRTGVSCYSSSDLYRWKRESTALPKEAMPPEFRDKGVVERPKVLYNAATRKYVMWMHLDDSTYRTAQAGVAVADAPAGPFRFVRAFRPIQYDAGFAEHDRARQKQLGGTYRDMNLFLDEDGRAYVFYASEDNWTLYVARLDREFLDVERPAVEGKTWARVLVRDQREAPAPFRYRGRYYLITSGCTGWAPNAATYAVADHILGPYVQQGNPMAGPDADKTFFAQSTFVMRAPGAPEGSFIFMADRWNKDRLEDSRYVWLPFRVADDGSIRISWMDRWDLSWFRR
jgi:beta-xylosidase